MLDARHRLLRRLFYFATVAIALMGVGLSAFGAPADSQSGTSAATTTVSDTVDLADGTTASGTLIITWPAFVTSGGTAVAAGSTSVVLGANGALSVALVPNAGGTRRGCSTPLCINLALGKRRLSIGAPTNSPVSLAAVRTTPGSGFAARRGALEVEAAEAEIFRQRQRQARMWCSQLGRSFRRTTWAKVSPQRSSTSNS